MPERLPEHLKVRVNLWGDFRVEGSDGEDITPRSAKNRALVAALATNTSFERSRVWLQNKLWSTGEVEQAQGNLRKAVHDLRVDFGRYRDAILSDRQSVGLAQDAVEVLGPTEANGEFLGGLEVGDREFDQWLFQMRLSARAQGKGADGPSQPMRRPTPRKRIVILAFRSESAEADWVVSSLADEAAAALRESLPADVIVETVEAGSGLSARNDASDLIVEIQVAPVLRGEISLRLSVSRSSTLERLWGQKLHFAQASLQLFRDPSIARAVAMLSEGIAKCLHNDAIRRRSAQGALLEPVLGKIFSMQADGLREADEALQLLYEEFDDATYLAWRSQIRTIQYIERHLLDREGLAEAAQEFALKAMEDAPFNATVLSVAANTAHFLENDSVRAAELAQHAVSLQPINALARWSLSTAALYVGDLDLSVKHATYGRTITHSSSRKFWWELQMGATYLARGELDRALNSFLAVHRSNPQFRPPIRYMIGLFAHQKRWDEAEEAVKKLQALEDEFSVERLLTDRAYPASLLFRPNGLKLDHLREFW
ncbi:hypothetical protein [Gymnodinialimonas sp.]